MNTRKDTNPDENVAPSRRSYVKPAIQRVDLALEETLSAGCKLVDGCDDNFDPEGKLAGS